MLNVRTTRRFLRKVLSLVLILAVMLSLAVPYTVNAEETAARDDNIYAFVYKADPNKGTTNLNLELVFQNNPNRDLSKVYIAGPYSNFAGTPYHTKTYKYDGNSNITVDVQNQKNPVTGKNVPWYDHVWSIIKVTFANKIAPTYIASWFYNF